MILYFLPPVPVNMPYHLYRTTTIGTTLQDSLDELIAQGRVPTSLAQKILLRFDRSVQKTFSSRTFKPRLTFKAEKLYSYNFCNEVWTFNLRNIQFRDVYELAFVDKLKIVACAAEGATTDAGRKKKKSLADLEFDETSPWLL